MITAPFALIFNEVLNRLRIAPQLRYAAQDIGQLDFYEMRPPVGWPCALIDIDEISFSDIQNDHTQMGEGFITIRVGQVKYTDANNLTPSQYMEAALKYYETEQAVHLALHAWAPPLDGVGRLMRSSAATEKRDDDIRVRRIKYGFAFKDVSTKPVKTKVAVPEPVINGAIQTLEGVGYWIIENDNVVS